MAVETIHAMSGTALPVRGDDIDTDRIIPARFLKSISFEGLENHLFEDDRREVAAAGSSHPVDRPEYRGASVMLVNANFGCGSSREHAPQAIRRRGIRAIVGQSYSEIFFGNAIALGMPCVTAPPATLSALMAIVERDPSTIVTVDLDRMRVSAGAASFEIALPAAARGAFLDGSWDATGLLLDDYDAVRAVAAKLPYVSGAFEMA